MKKIEAGVEFFQTQYAFDENILKNYMLKLNELHITDKTYFIIGLGVIKSAKSARWMNKNLFGINIPEKIINRIEQSNDESLDEKKQFEFDVWYNPKNNLILKVTYNKMGNWEYRLRSFE